MITTIFNKAKRASTLVAVASCFALTSGSLAAFASVPVQPAGSGLSDQRTVFEVNVMADHLTIFLLNDPVTYVAYTSGSPCPGWVASADTVKSFATMSQAALLAGKKLRINFNICRPTGVMGPEFPTNTVFMVGMEIFQ